MFSHVINRDKTIGLSMSASERKDKIGKMFEFYLNVIIRKHVVI